MDETKRISWDNLARTSASLRFPNVSLNVISPFNLYGRGRIELKTFICSKNRERITLYERVYETIPEGDIFDFIAHIKKRFLDEGKIIAENFIFDKNHSIMEPFELNTIKR